ncbi:hypothetical protein SNEBB_001174 [Seison nebaliae]|nr:hypothetical protein SNEBB_001174 [Seison nebaliae]
MLLSQITFIYSAAILPNAFETDLLDDNDEPQSLFKKRTSTDGKLSENLFWYTFRRCMQSNRTTDDCQKVAHAMQFFHGMHGF